MLYYYQSTNNNRSVSAGYYTILLHLENMLTLAVCMYCNECCI